MTTARQIITNALASVGVLEAGQPISADDAQRALVRLNDMIDSWASGSLSAGSTNELIFSLGGQQKLTIGPTGDIVAPVPPRIEGGFVRIGNFDYHFEMVGYAEYSSIAYKTQPGPWPSVAYYDNIGTIYFYPLPAGGELHLSVLSQIGQFADLDIDYTLQTGARKALGDTLAEEIAQDYGRQLSPAFMQRAAHARYALRRQNLSIPILDVPMSGRGGPGNIMNPPDPDGYQGGNAGDMLHQ